MKLEPNMYVRTKDGDMFILDKIEDNHLIPRYVHIPYIITEEDVLKTSHNIIDLIEVGDFVNGEIVIGFGTFYYDDGTIERTSLTLDRTVTCLNSEIKSVITHEQMEQMEYKVGDDK